MGASDDEIKFQTCFKFYSCVFEKRKPPKGIFANFQHSELIQQSNYPIKDKYRNDYLVQLERNNKMAVKTHPQRNPLFVLVWALTFVAIFERSLTLRANRKRSTDE